MKKIFLSSILVTIALLLGVMLFQWTMLLLTKRHFALSGSLSKQTMAAGAVADTLRAIIITYLYQNTRNAGTSLFHALGFGMATSLLVATLYVFYQYGARPGYGLEFLLSETAVTVIQGILSGIALWIVFKKRPSHTLK